MEQRLKVAAYGVCVQEGRILLARYVTPDGSDRYWTLPGGKIEHTEDPYDAVVREVAEETGYQVEVQRLLGVHSRFHEVDWGIPGGAMLQNIGVFYRVQISGGELRVEIDGSTDLAEWVPVATLAELDRAVIVDIGLNLNQAEPATGHIDPIPVHRPLRH